MDDVGWGWVGGWYRVEVGGLYRVRMEVLQGGCGWYRVGVVVGIMGWVGGIGLGLGWYRLLSNNNNFLRFGCSLGGHAAMSGCSRL